MDDNNILRHDERRWDELSHGDRYAARRCELARGAGARNLGCSLYEIEPGKAAWPMHFHHANEEALFVLSGTGRMRTLEGDDIEIGPGDYVACLVGPEGAREVWATGEETFRYLVISEMKHPEIAEYPETGKVGLFAGSAPGGDREARTLGAFLDRSAEREYWDGVD